MQSYTQLSQEYTIPTPENVSFGYEVVGIGNRFIATLFDSAILLLLFVAINLLLAFALDLVGAFSTNLLDFAEEIGWSQGILIAIYTLLQFLLIWGYYIGFEWLWQGQTPGKRWTKIRVVRIDGNPVGFGEVAIRNLVRIIDFLPATYALGLVTMFFSENARRLEPHPIDEADPLYTRYVNIRALSSSDYALIDELLKRYNRNRVDFELLNRAANSMRKKLNLDENEVSTIGSLKLLEEIAEAYRRYA